MFGRKACVTTYVVCKTRSVLDRNLNYAYRTPTKHTRLRAIRRGTGYCERGVRQGRQLPVDGGEIKSDQHPIAAGWSLGGAGGANANGSSGGEGGSSGGGSGRTRDKALRCSESPGAVSGIGHRDGGVASQRVGRPLSLPWIGLHDGAARGDHGGVG